MGAAYTAKLTGDETALFPTQSYARAVQVWVPALVRVNVQMKV